jgi:hypothetical protein
MRWLLNSKGQSIVEIALMTPLILVALYVPFDFGMTIFTGHITQKRSTRRCSNRFHD